MLWCDCRRLWDWRKKLNLMWRLNWSKWMRPLNNSQLPRSEFVVFASFWTSLVQSDFLLILRLSCLFLYLLRSQEGAKSRSRRRRLTALWLTGAAGAVLISVLLCLELAVSLQSVSWTIDYIFSIVCRYLSGFYTGTKLSCLVTESWVCVNNLHVVVTWQLQVWSTWTAFEPATCRLPVRSH